jgi:nucleoside 2-deoxyribosyltransferase
MNVHIVTSRITIEEDIESLREIVGLIKDLGHSLSIDWIEQAYARQTGETDKKADWREIYRSNLEAIAKSDVIIAEASHENFGVGFQVAVAADQKKPVLLLRRNDVDASVFAVGVEKDGWVVYKAYDSSTLHDTIRDFLNNNDLSSKDLRFNFFTDRKTYNYLRWASLRTGKSKAEVLRDLVQREVERQNIT